MEGGSLLAVPATEPTVKWTRHSKNVVDAAIMLAKDTTEEKAAASWQSRHMLIRHDDQPTLGNVPVNARICWAAGWCLCDEPGVLMNKFATNFMQAEKSCAKLYPKKAPLHVGILHPRDTKHCH